jgi:hypothetical protein
VVCRADGDEIEVPHAVGEGFGCVIGGSRHGAVVVGDEPVAVGHGSVEEAAKHLVEEADFVKREQVGVDSDPLDERDVGRARCADRVPDRFVLADHKRSRWCVRPRRFVTGPAGGIGWLGLWHVLLAARRETREHGVGATPAQVCVKPPGEDDVVRVVGVVQHEPARRPELHWRRAQDPAQPPALQRRPRRRRPANPTLRPRRSSKAVVVGRFRRPRSKIFIDRQWS